MSEPFTQQNAPARAARAVIVAAGLAACVSYLSGAAAGIGTSDRDYVFTPGDPPWSQSMVPALDVPIGAPPSTSVLAARGSIAIAQGRRSAARDLAAVSTAFATMMFAAWLLAAGIPVFPAALATVAMSASAMFWARGVAWSADTLSPVLALMAASSLWRWLDTGRRSFAITAFIVAALALSENPSWLAVLPGIAALLWHRQSAGGRARAIGAVAAVAVFAAAPFVVRAIVALEMPWANLIGEAPPGAFTLWAQSIIAGPASLGTLMGDLSRELTPLGVALAVIGVAVLLRTGLNRLATALAVVALLIWYAVAPRSRFEPIAVPFAVCGWAAIAVALAWLYHAAPPRAARALVAIVGVLLIAEPSLTRMRLAMLGRDLPSELRSRMASDFRAADLPEGAALIAESRRVDAAILLSSRQAGQPAMIVPQSPDRVTAVATTRPLFAFASARANLERVGFLFERDWANATPISVLAGHVPCVDLERGKWPDVSLHVAAGSLSLHGDTPDAAPGGVVLRLTAPEPIRLSTIEPRSIPFEITENARDASVAGVPELDRVATRGGLAIVTTIRVPETGRIDPVTLSFDRAPFAAVATGEGPAPVRLCAGVYRADLTLGRADSATAALRMDAPAPFGAGWHPVEADPDDFRWTAAPGASVRIIAARPTPVRVTITAAPAARPAQKPAIDLTVNACRLPAKAMPPGQGDYEWDVPENCWQSGFNQIWIGTNPLVSPASLFGGHDTRLLGARVGAIRFARLPRR